MAKKCAPGERQFDLLASALVAAACCTIIAVVLWVPVARAEVILSGLPGVITIATTRLRARQQKPDQALPGDGRDDSGPQA